MPKLLQAQALCLEMMNKHGLTAAAGWKFKWINSKNVAGKCSTNGGRKVIGRTYGGKRIFMPTGITNGGTIMLSKFVTQHHDDAKVLDTILHEIAHGLTPGHGHDYVWKSKARSIGCNGERCYDVNDSETLVEAKRAVSNIIGTCPLCKKEWHKARMPKRDLWCKCTQRRFKQEEKIVYVANSAKQTTVTKSTPIPTPRIPIAASRGFNQYATAAQSGTCFPNNLLNQAPDSYKSMLDKFEREFMPLINNDVVVFKKIINKAQSTSTSWRTMNREVRKACNQYMGDTDKMSNKAFQEMFFYESIMIGRTTWGKNAPWISGKPS